MITLVLGGARSGKSEVAERLAAASSPACCYIATGAATDPEMTARIAAHQARRPPAWTTVEAGDDLPAVLRSVAGPALVDSLGTWLAGRPDFVVDTEGLCQALQARVGDTVVVSEEVGLGVHPSTPAGRRFRDELGLVNQRVAAVADQVVLVVAGRALRLEVEVR